MKNINDIQHESFFTAVDEEIYRYLNEMARQLQFNYNSTINTTPNIVSVADKKFHTPLSTEAYELYQTIIGEKEIDVFMFNENLQKIIEIIFNSHFKSYSFNDFNLNTATNLEILIYVAHLYTNLLQGIEYEFSINDLNILSGMAKDKIMKKLDIKEEQAIPTNKALSFLKECKSDLY
ncbi:MAG: hypothetical protein ACOCRK_01485 [bacterium]